METESISRNTENLRFVTQTLIAIQDGDRAKFRELWEAERSAEEWRGIADMAVLSLIDSRLILREVAEGVLNALASQGEVPEGLHLDAHRWEEMKMEAGKAPGGEVEHYSLRDIYAEWLLRDA